VVSKTLKAGADGDERSLSGVTKAAILLMALKGDVASRVLKLLDDELIEEVSREIAQLDMVDQQVRGQVIEEFYNLALARQYVEVGGLHYARTLLQKALGPEDARRILSVIEHQVYEQPFAFLSKTDSENLMTFIQDEHPQTIALVLAHMSATKAAEVLMGLPNAKQLEVVSRVANMEQTNPEVIKEVERGLEARLAGITSQRLMKVGGVESVAEMLNLADRATERSIMEGLEQQDPELVEQIRRLMFVFEDILLVNDKGIQAVLKEIDNDELALALKTASDELKNKIFSNMSERAATLIREDMDYMGPVRLKDVEAAQQKIVDVVRRLEDAGEIIISGRGGEKDMI
jgi:flagellar motor switch protein FliG